MIANRGSGLVEREREMDSLAASLDRLDSGEGGTVLVEGPAGIGKSALLAATRGLAIDRGIAVLAARGSELEIDFPFGVVRQLFEAELIDPERREIVLADAARAARAVFADVLGADEDGSEANFSVLHGLYWTALNIAEEAPLLLVVDDLHWVDRASLRFLAYLSRRLDGAQISLLCGKRSTDPGVDPALIAEIGGDPSTRHLEPAPLSQDGVAAVVEGLFERPPDQRFRRDCDRATGGNPLLLRQLLSALESEGVTPTADAVAAIDRVGPQAVSRTVLPRLIRLPVPALEVSHALAILGDGSSVESLAALAGQELPAVAAVTGELTRASIIRPEPPLGFVHPLVRDAIYKHMAPGERELAHAQAARLMAEAGASAERIAAQLLASPASGEAWAADVLREAARSAAGKGAIDSVVAYLTRLLEEPQREAERARTLFELGLAELHVSGPAAVEHLQEAHATLEEPELRGRAGYALAWTLIFIGLPDEAAAVGRTMAAELPEELADLRLANQAMEAMTIYFDGAVDGLDKRIASWRELPVGDSVGSRMISAAAVFDWAMRGGSVADCVPVAQQVVADDVLLAADNGLLWVGASMTLVLADRPQGLEVWERTLGWAHKRGSLFGLLTAHLWLAATQLEHGDVDGAIEGLRENIDEAEAWSSQVIHIALGYLTIGLIHRGELAAARQIHEKLGAPARGQDGVRVWRRAEVELLLAEGRHEAAVVAADRYREELDWIVNPAWGPWRSQKARALDRLGRTEEAVGLAEEELVHARAWGAPATVGRSLRVLGQLRRSDGIEVLEEAVGMLEGSLAKLELAHALAALGGALRRERRPTDARDPLRRAFELAEVCGATALAADVRGELHAAGARPRNSALKGPDSLTASERRVADLAAGGQTNKQIAQELYVTPKTVEVHLSSAYRKLEISSRRELAGALAEAEPAR